jgi:hypothetical protein
MRCYDFYRSLLLRIGIAFARSTGAVTIDDSGDQKRSPRFLGNPLVPMPRSQTRAGPPRLALRTTEVHGELPLTDGFRLRHASLPVPHSVPGRCLAASWRFGNAPVLVKGEGAMQQCSISGLHRAASAHAVYAS